MQHLLQDAYMLITLVISAKYPEALWTLTLMLTINQWLSTNTKQPLSTIQPPRWSVMVSLITNQHEAVHELLSSNKTSIIGFWILSVSMSCWDHATLMCERFHGIIVTAIRVRSYYQPLLTLTTINCSSIFIMNITDPWSPMAIVDH